MNSKQLSQTVEEIIIVSNILGMIHLKKGWLLFIIENFPASLNFLKKAESYSKNNARLRAITCNNLACYYSRDKKVRTAVGFLESALSMEYKTLKDCVELDTFENALLIDNPSDAHLNLCVSLSELGKHEEALENGLQALVFIQNEIIERGLGSGSSSEEDKKGEHGKANTENLLKPLRDRYAVLCIAYHNIGAQYEFLRNVLCFSI